MFLHNNVDYTFPNYGSYTVYESSDSQCSSHLRVMITGLPPVEENCIASQFEGTITAYK